MQSRKTAALDASASQVELRATEEKLARDTRKAFYRLLLLREQVRVAELAVDIANVGMARTAEEYRFGLSSERTKRQAEIAVESEKLSLERRKADERTALASLRSLLGLEAGTELNLIGSLSFEALKLDSSPAIADRKDLALRAAQIAVQASRIAEDRYSRTIPSLGLSAQLSSSVDDLFPESSQFSLADRVKNGASFSLTLSTPNLGGLLPFSREKVAASGLQDTLTKQQLQLADALRLAALETASLATSLELSRLALASLSSSLSLAEENLRLSQEAYKVGAASYQELRTAEKDLNASRAALISERYTYLALLIDLEYATGQQLR
ncbi:hypothetical protein MASR2M78_06560 [Treponema sp.]